MSDPKHARENDTPQAGAERTNLAERPARRANKRVSVLVLVICACLLIMGGAGVLVWQLTFHPTASSVSSAPPATSSSSAKQSTGCTGAREPVDVIQQQTAQGLHLTVAQVQVQVLAGKTIAQIAAAQGLTAAQLHAVEIQALHVANNHWLSLGCITQQDVQDNLQRDIGTPVYMDVEFTDWFGGHL
jgi:cytoskeletal protein RodZ